MIDLPQHSWEWQALCVVFPTPGWPAWRGGVERTTGTPGICPMVLKRSCWSPFVVIRPRMPRSVGCDSPARRLWRRPPL